MSDRIHVLAQQILHKNSLEECDIEDIRSLVNKYPYFAPAQFLLLEKLKEQINPAAYQSQLQRSVLYYHNPVAFEYFIASDSFLVNEPVTISRQDEWQAPLQPEENEKVQPSPVVVEDDTAVNEIPVPDHINETREHSEVSLEEMPGEIVAKDEVILEKSIARETEADTISIPGPVQFTEEPKAELSFEPYHTVDYFASQGIKLSQESEPKDQFGRQLKSFTEWLRTMKKIPASVPAAQPSQSEEKVQHMAEDSVHQSEVVTETMAEVWLKQGNREKAIETYNKLSLLNPSKKAYFAARIENLKRS